ncbi:MAG: ATP phosphoribosyltransferase [Hyphomicrobium sp.]|nr:MAG: ATP phosphoribosyltransferase [Hyphomicrobium sp.]PPC99009.1 MAG: ATP phosphoribosyltransferase [Hyphomicrobium sp.]
MSKLTLAIPSKGRLMEQTTDMFARAGLSLRKTGHARGYRGEIEGLPDIEIAYVSSSEIAAALKSGSVHCGITGEDLVRESMSDAATRVTFLKRLGFGFADVVVAVPACWIDVATVADLEDIAVPFRRAHGRWPRVATKYMNLTRAFFAEKGFGDYRIVESLGATEGTPAAGAAELIVDITTTGETLRANGLKILDDGVILKSEANLVASNVAAWSPWLRNAQNTLLVKLNAI